jgi:hypothetical protein
MSVELGCKLLIALMLGVALVSLVCAVALLVQHQRCAVLVTPENWRAVASQAIADITHCSVAVAELVDLQMSPVPRMRFLLVDGRICDIWMSGLSFRRNVPASRDLWQFFATRAGWHSLLPAHARWIGKTSRNLGEPAFSFYVRHSYPVKALKPTPFSTRLEIQSAPKNLDLHRLVKSTAQIPVDCAQEVETPDVAIDAYRMPMA